MLRGTCAARQRRSLEVLLRPDDVVHDDAAPTKAEVVHKAFRGAEILYTLRLASGRKVLALVPSHHNHAIGERIGIRLDVDHVVAFAPRGKRCAAGLRIVLQARRSTGISNANSLPRSAGGTGTIGAWPTVSIACCRGSRGPELRTTTTDERRPSRAKLMRTSALPSQLLSRAARG